MQAFPDAGALRTPRLLDDLLLYDGIDAAHIDVFLQCLCRLEVRGSELDAQGVVSERADRRAGGTRHRWPKRGP